MAYVESGSLVWLSSDDSDDDREVQVPQQVLNRRPEIDINGGGKRQKVGRLESLNDDWRADTSKGFSGTESPINRNTLNQSINSERNGNGMPQSYMDSPPLFVSEPTHTPIKPSNLYPNMDFTSDTPKSNKSSSLGFTVSNDSLNLPRDNVPQDVHYTTNNLNPQSNVSEVNHTTNPTDDENLHWSEVALQGYPGNRTEYEELTLPGTFPSYDQITNRSSEAFNGNSYNTSLNPTKSNGSYASLNGKLFVDDSTSAESLHVMNKLIQQLETPGIDGEGSANNTIKTKTANNSVNTNNTNSIDNNANNSIMKSANPINTKKTNNTINSLNSQVEIISIDSDSDDDVIHPILPEDVIDIDQPTTTNRPASIQHVNVFQNDQFKPRDSAKTPTKIHNWSSIPQQNPDSDDEIVVLDADDVANKKFKPSSFDRRSAGPNQRLSQFNQLNQIATHPNMNQDSTQYQFPHFNRPAPIVHAGDLNGEEQESVILQQLRHKEQASLEEQEKLKKLVMTANVTQVNLQNAAKTIRNNILSGMETIRRFIQQGVGPGAVSKVQESIDKSKGELLSTLNKINHVQNQSNAFKKRAEMISLSLRQVGGLIHHYLGHMQPNPFQSVYQEEPHKGYSNNIYEDNQDLQNLLDNIKSDEDLEEGLEFTPKEMSINLMKHQRMGLTWLKRMEESKSHGGILADDMGLGKTIQTIALIVSNPPKEDESRTTLIIAPVSLLRQWAAEIESKLKPEFALTIGIYHGLDKKNLNSAKRLLEYDIILTSYGTLSSEWKKHFMEALTQSQEDKVPNFIPKAGTGGRSYTSPFYTQESKFLRIILDEAQNIKNKLAIASRAVASLNGTYRFCLSGTPMQNNIDELYPIIRFLGIRPYNSFEKFRADISIPLKDNNQYDSRDREGSMRKVRAILKAILLRRTKTTMIDGKPLLSLPEKHVIAEYVKMEKEELEFYASLEAQTKRKAEKLLNSKTRGKASSILTLLLRLRQACIHKYLVEIGEMKGEQHNSSTHSKKPKDYDRLYSDIKNLSPTTIQNVHRITGSSLTKKETSVDCRPEPVKNELSLEMFNGGLEPKRDPFFPGNFNEIKFPKDEEVEEMVDDDNMFTCPICLELFSTDDPLFIFSKCGHMICLNCVDTFFDTCEVDEDSSGVIAECKDCKTRTRPTDLINYRLFQRVHDQGYELDDFSALCRRLYGNVRKDDNAKLLKQLIIRDDGFNPSVKIEKSVELVQKIIKDNPDEKIIIFSQFTTLFDLMKLVLGREEIQFLRYDGSMSVEEKNSTIKAFYQSDCKVLLISLRAGNVGLTLTCASHVIIMDPFWNPFVEEQAQDRAHRIGQAREVYVHRILIEGTVESRIMELQDKKKELVGSALDENGMKSVSKLGRQELGFLFGLNRLN